MKQIVIRLLAPGIRVYDFCYGEIVDGQFHLLDANDLPSECTEFIRISNLLGTQAYICSDILRDFIEYIIPNTTDFGYYDHLITFTLNPDYGTEEKEE